jgi:N-formylglutamate amidohydrolase
VSEIYRFHEGNTPLLISVPHDGREVPDGQRARMTGPGLELPDTDWHVARLYDFARRLGASIIVANYSRYVVDLNRPVTDDAMYEGQVATGLCPRYSFAGEPLYLDDEAVSGDEVDQRVERYWRPYHERLEATLGRILARHGQALLWDAHSIASRVPRLFDGELPVLNLGTFDDRSCDSLVSAALLQAAMDSPYSAVLNGRFKGGYITRHYGAPERGVQAVQLELAQRAYMDEHSRDYDSARASQLSDSLSRLLETFLAVVQ